MQNAPLITAVHQQPAIAASPKVKVTLLLVSSLTIMSIITISPALPGMAAAFAGIAHADLLVKLVLTIPALLIAVVSPVTGYLIDKQGRLKLLWGSLLLYAVAGGSGFFLNNLYLILLSRALLGVAVGMSMTIVITLIADYFEGAERQSFVGTQVAFMSLGGILFIGLGGVLADWGWHYPFLLYFFSLLVLPLSIAFLYEPVLDSKSGNHRLHIKAPAITWLLFVNTMMMWIVFFLIPVQIPFYLKAMGIEKNALIGAAIATSTLSSAITSFSYARIKTRLGFLSVFSLGYALMAAGFVLIAFANSYLVVIIAMMLSGAGIGMMIPNTNMWVMKIVQPAIRGKEIGKLTTFWFLGQFLSPILLFPLVQAVSLSAVFLWMAGFLLLLSAGFFLFSHSASGKRLPQ